MRCESAVDLVDPTLRIGAEEQSNHNALRRTVNRDQLKHVSQNSTLLTDTIADTQGFMRVSVRKGYM